MLILDKSLGASSNAAMQQVRRLYAAAKAGHGGTLDPLATGLLPILFGEATKFSSDLLEADKSYLAELKLGESTTTADAEGEIIAARPVASDIEQIEAALTEFRGNIQQVPPLYSALKHKGKPMYAYAREGVDVERKARPVSVHRLEIAGFDGLRLSLSIDCSKGTYIRSLAHDLGERLGCGAHLSALRRTRIGRFGLESCHSLDQLGALDEAGRDALLLPVDSLLQSLPSVRLDQAETARFSQGQQISWAESFPGRARVYGSDGRFLGVAECTDQGNLAARRLVSQA